MDYSYYAFQLEAERRSLLVFAYRQDIIESAKINPTTIIVGEKGSEKPIQITQHLLESDYFLFIYF